VLIVGLAFGVRGAASFTLALTIFAENGEAEERCNRTLVTTAMS
jgi:hypothetical protein